MNLGNYGLFGKIFLTKIHKYTENVFGIFTDCSLFTKFFLTNSFHLYGLPIFSHVPYVAYTCECASCTSSAASTC